jgi:hypothetical protein
VENGQNFRDFYENFPIAYFFLDKDGMITKCNNRTAELSGYSKEVLVGKNIHDLHYYDNILIPISGCIQILLLDDGNKSLEANKHLQTIHDCSRYVKDLVNKMLTFGKQKGYKFELLKPADVIKDALNLTKSLMPDTIQMEMSIKENLGLIMADSLQIHQVGMNPSFQCVLSNGKVPKQYC